MASIIQGKGNGTAAEGSPDTFPVLQTAFAQLSEATPGDRSSVPPRTSIAHSQDSRPDEISRLSFSADPTLSPESSPVLQTTFSYDRIAAAPSHDSRPDGISMLSFSADPTLSPESSPVLQTTFSYDRIAAAPSQRTTPIMFSPARSMFPPRTDVERSPYTSPISRTDFAQSSETTPADRSSVPPRTSIANSSDSTPDAGVVNLSFLPNEILSLIFSYVFQSNGSIEMYGTLREVCPQSRRFQDIIDNLIFLP